MLKKLNKNFVKNPKPCEISKIDKEFNFIDNCHILTKSKSKQHKSKQKEKGGVVNCKNFLESTNTSVKNGSNTKMKRQKTEMNMKKRFMSCDVYKSGLLKTDCFQGKRRRDGKST